MPKIVLKKVLAGILLIALSAGITVLIKEALDTLDPESSLPLFEVSIGGNKINEVYRAGYEWSFFTTMERQAPRLSESDIPLVPVETLPQAPIQLSFSKQPSEVRIFRSESGPDSTYMELVNADPMSFSAPVRGGMYVYKVQAQWNNRGEIQYYFAVHVRDFS